MNKMNKFLIIASMVILAACSSDDERKTHLRLSIDGETFNLANPKLYLTYSSPYISNEIEFEDRYYFISDGTYMGGASDDGWELSDYEGATYVLAIEIAAQENTSFSGSSFPQRDTWYDIPNGTNIGYIQFKFADNDFFRTDNMVTEDFSPIVVTGGVEHGNTMTIKFKGKLTRFVRNQDDDLVRDETVTADLAFTGKVIDKRSL
jgi:hypothetical protein